MDEGVPRWFKVLQVLVLVLLCMAFHFFEPLKALRVLWTGYTPRPELLPKTYASRKDVEVFARGGGRNGTPTRIRETIAGGRSRFRVLQSMHVRLRQSL